MSASRQDPIKELLDKFSDPSSPYYLAPGEVGPASPDESNPHSEDLLWPASTPSFYDARVEARERLESEGYQALVEWPVAWGQIDQYGHVNNVHYASWLETARLHFVAHLKQYDLSQPIIEDMIKGRNQGIILKQLTVRYKAPIEYPDSVVLGTIPHTISPSSSPSSFSLSHAVYSLTKRRVVATGESEMVCYDYNTLKKGKMQDEIKLALLNAQEVSSEKKIKAKL